MKILVTLLCICGIYTTSINAQTTIDSYSLKGNNLHKNVRKVINHYYTYDYNSGGFVKKGVYIDMYNDNGMLAESLSQYYGTYSEDKPATKTQYNYDGDGKIISTEDITSGYSKYSSYLKFTYNGKNNLIKKETINKKGKTYTEIYTYDKKNRITSSKKTDANGKLTSETQITYKGSKRTEIKTTYSTKDGSINGQYTYFFKDNIKVKSSSNSKWANSNTIYQYDNNNNILRSIYTSEKGKQPSISNYKYIYDKKDNWIKKHYKNGKYNSFYFREIYFKNDDITGSTMFDKKFINKNGNFENVSVVPLKKKKLKNSTIITNNKMPEFKYKNWVYNYAYYEKELKNWQGTIDLTVKDATKMNTGSKIEVGYTYPGEDRYTVKYTVGKYFAPSKKYNYHQWILNLQGKTTKGSLILYKQEKILTAKNVKIIGILQIPTEKDDLVGYYLQKK